jgi:galactose oxidase-like protein
MKRSLAAIVSVAVLVVGCQTSASPSPAAPSVPATPAGTQPASVPPSVAVVTPPSPSPTAARPGHWVQVTADAEPVDTRVALAGGRVLNMSVSQPENEPATMTAQLWDPAADRSKATAALPAYRQQYVSLGLADGRAIVTGGLNDHKQSYSSTYLYDPRTDAWTKSGLLGTARTSAAGAVLKDGRVLVAGGYYTNGKGPGDEMGTGDGAAILAAFRPRLADIDLPDYAAAMATAEIFDLSTGAWSPTGSMTYARSGAEAVTLADGRVMMFGSTTPGNGIKLDAAASTTAEIFDPATGKFTMTGPLPPIDAAALQAKGKPGANPVPDEEPYSAFGHPLALPDGGAVVIGFSESWKHVGDLSRSLRYDATANTWSEIGDPWILVGEPTEHFLYFEGVPNLAASASAALPDGRILIAGGTGPLTVTTSSDGVATVHQSETAAGQFYEPAGDAWTAAPPLPEAQTGSRALVLADGSVLVDGGTHCSGDGNEFECVPVPAARYIP